MSERFFIRLGSEPPEALAVDDQGYTTTRSTRGELAELARRTEGRPVVVFVPAAEVLLTDVEVPAASRQRLAKAVPYLLEDTVAEEVEDLHFALGPKQADGRMGVAAVTREHMDAWAAALTEAGIQPRAVVPETLSVPLEPGGWAVAVTDETALVRTGPEAGFVFDTANLGLLFAGEIAAPGGARPESVVLHDCRSARDTDLGTVTGLADSDLPWRVEDGGDGPLALLARGYDEARAIDLQQGDYSRRERLGQYWRPWRPAAALAGVWLLLQGGLWGMEYYQLSSEATALRGQIEQTFQRSFPGIGRIVNPRVQAERALTELRGGGGDEARDFLDLVEGVGRQFRDLDDAELRSLAFKDGTMTLELRVAALQDLDRFEQALRADAGLDVNVVSASSREQGVEARLQVRSTT